MAIDVTVLRVFTDRDGNFGNPLGVVDASQAEDRAHRIGSEQHDSIEIVDIIASDTVDSQVREVLRGKAAALAELLADPRIAHRCLGAA